MRRWLAVAGVGAAVAALLSGCFLTSDDPDDVMTMFAEALHNADAGAAATLTDNPRAARAAITAMFDGLGYSGDSKKTSLATSGTIVDGKEATGSLKYHWNFGTGRDVQYETTTALEGGFGLEADVVADSPPP